MLRIGQGFHVHLTELHIDASDAHNRTLVSLDGEISAFKDSLHVVRLHGGRCELCSTGRVDKNILLGRLAQVVHKSTKSVHMVAELEPAALHHVQMAFAGRQLRHETDVFCSFSVEFDLYRTGFRIPYTVVTSSRIGNSQIKRQGAKAWVTSDPHQISWPSIHDQMQYMQQHQLNVRLPASEAIVHFLRETKVTIRAGISLIDPTHESTELICNVDSKVSYFGPKEDDNQPTVLLIIPVHVAGRTHLGRLSRVVSSTVSGTYSPLQSRDHQNWAEQLVQKLERKGQWEPARFLVLHLRNPNAPLGDLIGNRFVFSAARDPTDSVQTAEPMVHSVRRLQRALSGHGDEKVDLSASVTININDLPLFKVSGSLKGPSPWRISMMFISKIISEGASLFPFYHHVSDGQTFSHGKDSEQLQHTAVAVAIDIDEDRPSFAAGATVGVVHVNFSSEGMEYVVPGINQTHFEKRGEKEIVGIRGHVSWDGSTNVISGTMNINESHMSWLSQSSAGNQYHTPWFQPKVDLQTQKYMENTESQLKTSIRDGTLLTNILRGERRLAKSVEEISALRKKQAPAKKESALADWLTDLIDQEIPSRWKHVKAGAAIAVRKTKDLILKTHKLQADNLHKLSGDMLINFKDLWNEHITKNVRDLTRRLQGTNVSPEDENDIATPLCFAHASLRLESPDPDYMVTLMKVQEAELHSMFEIGVKRIATENSQRINSDREAILYGRHGKEIERVRVKMDCKTYMAKAALRPELTACKKLNDGWCKWAPFDAVDSMAGALKACFPNAEIDITDSHFEGCGSNSLDSVCPVPLAKKFSTYLESVEKVTFDNMCNSEQGDLYFVGLHSREGMIGGISILGACSSIAVRNDLIAVVAYSENMTVLLSHIGANATYEEDVLKEKCRDAWLEKKSIVEHWSTEKNTGHYAMSFMYDTDGEGTKDMDFRGSLEAKTEDVNMEVGGNMIMKEGNLFVVLHALQDDTFPNNIDIRAIKVSGDRYNVHLDGQMEWPISSYGYIPQEIEDTVSTAIFGMFEFRHSISVSGDLTVDLSNDRDMQVEGFLQTGNMTCKSHGDAVRVIKGSDATGNFTLTGPFVNTPVDREPCRVEAHGLMETGLIPISFGNATHTEIVSFTLPNPFAEAFDFGTMKMESPKMESMDETQETDEFQLPDMKVETTEKDGKGILTITMDSMTMMLSMDGKFAEMDLSDARMEFRIADAEMEQPMTGEITMKEPTADKHVITFSLSEESGTELWRIMASIDQNREDYDHDIAGKLVLQVKADDDGKLTTALIAVAENKHTRVKGKEGFTMSLVASGEYIESDQFFEFTGQIMQGDDEVEAQFQVLGSEDELLLRAQADASSKNNATSNSLNAVVSDESSKLFELTAEADLGDESGSLQASFSMEGDQKFSMTSEMQKKNQIYSGNIKVNIAEVHADDIQVVHGEFSEGFIVSDSALSGCEQLHWKADVATHQWQFTQQGKVQKADNTDDICLMAMLLQVYDEHDEDLPIVGLDVSMQFPYSTVVAPTPPPATPAPTPGPAVALTEIRMEVTLNTGTIFNERATKEELAQVTGVDPDQVVIEEIKHKVEVTYRFGTSLSEDEARRVIAEATRVPWWTVKVTLTGIIRRLISCLSSGRRLAGTDVTAEIAAPSAAAANTLFVRAGKITKILDRLDPVALNSSVALREAPVRIVVLKIDIRSRTSEPVNAPGAAALELLGERLGGTVMILEVNKQDPEGGYLVNGAVGVHAASVLLALSCYCISVS